MVYKAIGLMSGSSLDGLDIAYVHFHETGGKWSYEIIEADCYPYEAEWIERLSTATSLPASDYLLLHTRYGHFLGSQVNDFIDGHGLHHKVDLIASHGHTTFHMPSQKMTAQLGDGAALAASTGLPVISDLRALDLAFGGQGAPLVPVGEKLLLPGYDLLLNLGGIANISARTGKDYIAFDVCPANRILNMLAKQAGNEYDKDGNMAAQGEVDDSLLTELNALPYYGYPYPKSLANDFGVSTVYPLVSRHGLAVSDALRTCVEHICFQTGRAVSGIVEKFFSGISEGSVRMLVTGGGAHNVFLVGLLREQLERFGIELVVPDPRLVDYKEAVIMALIGVLRWREEYTVLSSVTGATRDSIGGALWLGGEA